MMPLSPSNASELILGAVAYDQKVVPIWDGFQQYFRTPRLAVRLRPLLELRATGRSPSPRARSRRVELSACVAADRAHRCPSRPAGGGHRHARHRSRPPQRHPGQGGRWHRHRRRPSRQDRRGGRARLSAGHADPVEPPRGSGTRPRSGLRGSRVRRRSSASTAITSAASATPSARYSAARPMPPASSTRTTWRSREKARIPSSSTRILAQTRRLRSLQLHRARRC